MLDLKTIRSELDQKYRFFLCNYTRLQPECKDASGLAAALGKKNSYRCQTCCKDVDSLTRSTGSQEPDKEPWIISQANRQCTKDSNKTKLTELSITGQGAVGVDVVDALIVEIHGRLR